MNRPISPPMKTILQRGVVIPASPLALDSERQIDERRQRAVWRYYSAAGAGGVAVGVHTTQFAIRDPRFGLFAPLLDLAQDEFDRLDRSREEPLWRITGLCGPTTQAVWEANLARDLGFHAGLLSLGQLQDANEDALLTHCRTVSEVLPVFGFYLQPAVGGRVLSYAFWRELATIDGLIAIKIAPFNRYQTLDVVRAVVDSGRDDVALYTGNDDNIVVDLLTTWRFPRGDQVVERRIVGGLLGHWAVWTRTACELLQRCHGITTPTNVDARRAASRSHWDGGRQNASEVLDLLRLGAAVTDMNAAIFDAANHYCGCIPGIHEVLRRQGLLADTRCLDPRETLSPHQADEITRVSRHYPELVDDRFVAQHLDEWLTL
jgi:dihydrodipicolinate synthase/N-acetylneuraminate lyase